MLLEAGLQSRGIEVMFAALVGGGAFEIGEGLVWVCA